MKRIFLGMVTAALALGLIGSAFATPSMFGSKGLFRVLDANNAGPMSFSIGAFGLYATKSKSYTGYKLDNNLIEVMPALSFTPIKFIELSAAVPYVVTDKYKVTPTTGTATEHKNSGMLDAEVALKFSYQFSPMFAAGLRALAYIPTKGDSFKAYRYSGTTRLVTDKNNVDVGGQALLSFNFMDKAKLHINGGGIYSMDERDTSFTATQSYEKINSKITVPYGLGLEYDGLKFVTPMVEVTGNYLMISDKDTLGYNIRKTAGSTATTKPGPLDQGIFITPGLKADFAFSGVHHLNLGVGVDVPFSSKRMDLSLGADSANGKAYYYDWQVIGGLTYSYVPPVGPKVPGTGSIAGTVTDLDGNPVSGADVAFTGTSVAPVTSGADGKFAATGLPVGMVTVSVSKDGFVTKDETPTIAKKKVANLAVKLEKKPVPKATLAGKVSDTEGKAVAGATVKAEGSTATTDVSGSYTMDVVVAQTGGTYNVDVTAPGYKDKSGTVALTPGQPAARDFTLVSVNLKMKLVINFKTGSAAILGQSGDISKAAGILKDNPNVKVEIAGYTDSRGSSKKNLKLSQGRADSVRDALIAAGVSAGQITTKGYGAGDPVASNKTKAGRAMNRRIELHVL
jgi:outer membrane protein OmpA-like peptidoglycan-associated protein